MNSCVFLLVLVAGVVSTKTFYPEISITGESGLRLGLVGKLLSLFVVNAIHIHFYIGPIRWKIWNLSKLQTNVKFISRDWLGLCDYQPMGCLRTYPFCHIRFSTLISINKRFFVIRGKKLSAITLRILSSNENLCEMHTCIYTERSGLKQCNLLKWKQSSLIDCIFEFTIHSTDCLELW